MVARDNGRTGCRVRGSAKLCPGTMADELRLVPFDGMSQ